MSRRPLLLPLRLAGAEALHERRFFALSALGLAAVLAPLLVLLALKHGVIDVLLTRLIQDPANREIRVALHGDYDDAFLQRLAAQPGVDFLVPQVRALSTIVRLAVVSADPPRIAEAELLPSAAGEPLLPEATPPPPADGIALSRDLAERLQLGVGDGLRVIVSRQRGGQEERVTLELSVYAIAERGRLGGRNALVPGALLLAFEDYRDDRSVPAFGWEGAHPPPATEARIYSRFRLYATRLEDVAPLADHLATLGIETQTAAAAIQQVTAMNRSLSQIFAVIAALGALGYLAALATSLWSHVERKRRALSLLRLLGLPAWGLAAFPMVQAAVIAGSGFLLALLLYVFAAWAINALFAEGLVPGERLAELPAGHVLLGALVTLLVALLAAGYAAWRARGVEPAEGLRDV